MKKNILTKHNSIMKQKKLYLFLMITMILSFGAGFLFYFALSNDSKKETVQLIQGLMNSLKENVNYTSLLYNSFFNNTFLMTFIWLLGISIFGIPIVLFIFIAKLFTLGFSFSAIIFSYRLKGIVIAFLYCFPHQLINTILLLLLTFYSLSFSIKLFKFLFFHQYINFKESLRRYIKIVALCFGISIFTILYEVYISSYLLALIS